jgi:hypothetical protein
MPIFPLDEYKHYETFEGSYGIVRMYQNKLSGVCWAAKSPILRRSKKETISLYCGEALLSIILTSQNVKKLFGKNECPFSNQVRLGRYNNEVVMVMPHGGMSLVEIFRTKGTLLYLLQCLESILVALSRAQRALNFCHRDFHTGNVLVHATTGAVTFIDNGQAACTIPGKGNVALAAFMCSDYCMNPTYDCLMLLTHMHELALKEGVCDPRTLSLCTDLLEPASRVVMRNIGEFPARGSSAWEQMYEQRALHCDNSPGMAAGELLVYIRTLRKKYQSPRLTRSFSSPCLRRKFRARKEYFPALQRLVVF